MWFQFILSLSFFVSSAHLWTKHATAPSSGSNAAGYSAKKCAEDPRANTGDRKEKEDVTLRFKVLPRGNNELHILNSQIVSSAKEMQIYEFKHK